MRSPLGSVGVVDAHAAAVAPRRPPRPHEQRAGLAHEPHAERPRSSTSPVRACSVARLVADQVAEQADRARLGLGRRAAALGAHDVGAALGVELGDDPGVREARER